MKISQNGLNLIKKWEGCRLTAYKDIVGVWTIGYGTTNADKAITNTEIKSGLTISQTIADLWLEQSVNKKYVPLVEKYSKYNFNQNQFDALVSFCYNIGSIDQLTANGTRSIKEIGEHITAYCNAGGKRVQGLVNRRNEELALYNTPCEIVSNSLEGSTLDLVYRTMKDEFGKGEERKSKLDNRYEEVQGEINHIMSAAAETLAAEVKTGRYGNDEVRRTVLGPRYDEVQYKVNATTKKEKEVTYTVKAGDTLSGIASKFNKSYIEIANKNGISNPNRIYVDQVLKI